MQHFSNYFVQILVIRSKCQAQGGTDGSEVGKKISGGQLSPLLPISRAYGLRSRIRIRSFLWTSFYGSVFLCFSRNDSTNLRHFVFLSFFLSGFRM